jgi:signal transduction histidine kinase
MSRPPAPPPDSDDPSPIPPPLSLRIDFDPDRFREYARRYRNAHGPRRARHVRLGCLIPLFFLVSSFSCLAALVLSLAQTDFPRRLPPLFFIGALVLFGLFIVALGGYLQRTVNPLEDVMDAADRVASGDYTARLKEQGPPRVREFTRSFNTMTARLEAYDEHRKRMLADISHELRTPLTVLQGNLEGMLDNVYPRDEEHITLLLEETQILSRLVDDLRTFSLAESGRLVLQKESVDPARLVSDLVRAMRSAAAKAGVSLGEDAEAGLAQVDLDPARMREVLENLVANAIRNTPAGGTVSVGCRRAAGAPPRLAFAVRDTGRGIPADLLPNLFNRYVKSVDSGGTGLGLAIARQLVEAHGGKIEAESEPGKGTIIRFWIPLDEK